MYFHTTPIKPQEHMAIPMSVELLVELHQGAETSGSTRTPSRQPPLWKVEHHSEDVPKKKGSSEFKTAYRFNMV